MRSPRGTAEHYLHSTTLRTDNTDSEHRVLALFLCLFFVSLILYADVWDDTVHEHFKPWMDMDVAHCPVLGAQEGFTGTTDLTPGMMYLLLESQPLFMPARELLSAEVAIGDTAICA
jgi:hypothetical protein